MILRYLLSDYQQGGLKILFHVTLGKNIAHLLVTGKSGSGKSLSVLWYIYQLLHNHESTVIVADYKAGVEYSTFEGSSSYASGLRAFQIIDNYYHFFAYVRNNHIRLPRHYTLIVEEWLGLLAYAETQDKKLKASCPTIFLYGRRDWRTGHFPHARLHMLFFAGEVVHCQEALSFRSYRTCQWNRDYIRKTGKWEDTGKSGTSVPNTFEEGGICRPPEAWTMYAKTV